MTSWLWNGTAFEPCDSLPISDRGFRYGMSVFESLRIADGRPHFLEQHLARLRHACSDRRFPLDERALAASRDLLREAAGDGFARIYVTAGAGNVSDPATEPRIYLFVEPRERHAPSACDIGIIDDVCHPLFGGLKTANYWMNVDALQRAQRSGHHEALLFNERAELVSACTANVFLVRGSRISTPSLHCGARGGVVREWVMQRRDVEECSLFVDDVASADEIFLTNSWVGVMSVTSLAGRVLASREVASSLGQPA